MIETIYSDPNFLEHHGILGMKWGVRRYQNKDGSLTMDGKKKVAENRVSKTTLDNEIRSAVSEEHSLSLDKKSNEMNNLANDINKKYEDHFTKALTDKKIRNDIWEDIIGQKDSIIDEFDFDDARSNAIDWNGPDDFDDRKKLDSIMKSYWDEIDEVSKPIIDKYKDSGIKVSELGDSAEYYVQTNRAKYHKDLSWNSYLNRHFEDYWINDLDSRYKLEDSFTYDDYLKRTNKSK